MKASIAKVPETPAAAVFPPTLHRVRIRGKNSAPNPKPAKRANIFSKSRDIHEDRGERQMKTSQSPQSLPHGR
jgi:hypothetical protein